MLVLPPAKRRKGKIAWKISDVLAAAESAAILTVRSWIPVNSLEVAGLSRGLNSRVVLPTERPLTSASVTRASHSIDATC